MPQVDINQTIEKWAEIAIDKLREALDTYDIGKLDGALWQSFAYQLVQNNGDIEKVVIKFAQYGRYVDMGVGRGVATGKRGTEAFSKYRKQNGQLHRYGRKPKPWYSKTKTKEVGLLRLILVRDYGVKTLADLETVFNRTEIVTIS
jgi:hypothetical protein